VFEGGGLYGSNDITGCSSYNNDSLLYDASVYDSDYDTKWCFDLDSSSANAAAVSSLQFTIIAPYGMPSPAWFRVSLWLYYNRQWNQINNNKGKAWYNYSIVSGYQAAQTTLSVDESVTITLLFGTKSVSDFETNCDGDVESGDVTYDSNFNLYDTNAQLRWLALCDKLNAIQDTVMYRKDDDQELCFSYYFNEYLNLTNISMPNQYTAKRALFNQFLTTFVGRSSSSQFGASTSYDPRDFKSWFGTAVSEQWSNENSSIGWVTQIVRTQMNNKWGGSTMYEYYQKWDDFMTEFNKDSPLSFKGVQTSPSYIRMEVEVAFLDGFVKSVLYTIILCAVVMVFFTQNLFLVALVCLYILIICIWVVGLFGAVGWPFGIIEIISVPTVVGLTIDYALHITHAYIHSPFPDRLRRAKSAVNDLGASVFASAMTTVSSMVILYFATIVIFSDLGWVVGSTTTFGVVLALFVCPPCLMYTGPQYDQCHFTWCCPKHQNGVKVAGHVCCGNEWHGVDREKYEQHEQRQLAKHQQQYSAQQVEEVAPPHDANELELQAMARHAAFDNDNEGAGAGPGAGAHAMTNTLQVDDNAASDDDDDDGVDDESLPDGWRAVLTDDGKVYYQNDVTHKTQWKKPEKVQPVAAAPQSLIGATSIQSEPDHDLAPSYREANVQQHANDNDNDDELYAMQPAHALDNNQSNQSQRPLVTKGGGASGDDDDDDDDNVPSAPAPPGMENESESENDEEEYVPAAPAPPGSIEEVDANRQAMQQAMITPGSLGQNDNDDNMMELEQSISFDPNADADADADADMNDADKDETM